MRAFASDLAAAEIVSSQLIAAKQTAASTGVSAINPVQSETFKQTPLPVAGVHPFAEVLDDSVGKNDLTVQAIGEPGCSRAGILQSRPTLGAPPADAASRARHPIDQVAYDPSFETNAASCFAASAQARAATGPFHVEQHNRDAATCEAVILNTAGGMAGGDFSRLDFTAGPQSSITLTTQANEKIYRSDGPFACIELDITIQSKARFEWLPQETILFHEAKLQRIFRVAMAADSILLLLECQIFGRLASGETHTFGSLRENWRIVRAGKLIFAEELRLEGDLPQKLDRKALGNGARAIATLLFAAPGAEARLEEFRTALPSSSEGIRCGASAWNGMLLARFTAVSPELLRRAMLSSLQVLRGCALPRVWQV